MTQQEMLYLKNLENRIAAVEQFIYVFNTKLNNDELFPPVVQQAQPAQKPQINNNDERGTV